MAQRNHWNGSYALQQATLARVDGDLRLDAEGHTHFVTLSLSPMTVSGATTIRAVAQEKTELVETSRALDQSQAELQSLSARILQLRDNERRRIARDLHDVTGQELAVVLMTLGSISHQVKTHPLIRDHLQEAVEDNGRGIDPQKIFLAQEGHSAGVGIAAMDQRLRQLGGRLHVTSTGHGTVVSACAPVGGVQVEEVPVELQKAQSSTQERKLYEALVSLEEGADLADYMAARKNASTRDRLLAESKQLCEHAALLREILEKRRSPAIPEMLEAQSSNIPID